MCCLDVQGGKKVTIIESEILKLTDAASEMQFRFANGLK